ncbi:MAG: hypothetical protein FWD47_09540 [Treponema sp.]|nr:hypothetical protein [Treponema sp.]
MNKKIFVLLLVIAIIAAACTPKSGTLDYSKIPSENSIYYRENEFQAQTPSADFEADGNQLTFATEETLFTGEHSYNVEFNNETIPVTVFRTAINEWTDSIDKLVFVYDGITHTFHFNGLEMDEAGGYNIFADDYNFDGFMDINFIHYVGLWVSTNDYIYLYDGQTKSYSLQNELSGDGKIEVDSETQTLRQTKQFFSTALEHNTSKTSDYKWENGELILFRTENIEYDGTLEMHIGTTRTLQNDGTWTEHKERAQPATP